MGLHHMGLHIASIHLAWRCIYFFFCFVLMKCIDVSTGQTSPLSSLTLPIHQTNREREEKRNEIDFCLFVLFFFQPQRPAWVWWEAVSDLSGEKLMSKIVLSAPEGYRQTTDNWIQGLSKTLRSNSSCFTGCKHRSSHLSDTFSAGRPPRYGL